MAMGLGPACRTRVALHAARGARSVSDYVRITAPVPARVSLQPNKAYGLATSRGERPYQEDAARVACVRVPAREVCATLAQATANAHAQTAVHSAALCQPGHGDEDAQLLWVSCFDGHGGPVVSGFLRAELPRIFESVHPELATDVVAYQRSLGGYFARYQGGLLQRWVRPELLPAPIPRRTNTRSRPRPPLASSAPRNFTLDQPQSLSALAARATLSSDSTQSSAPDDTPDALADAEADADHSPTYQEKSATASAGGVFTTDQLAAQAKSRVLNPLWPQDEPEKLTHTVSESAEASTAALPPDEPDEMLLTRTSEVPPALAGQPMTLAERATLAWLIADRVIGSRIDAKTGEKELDVGGSTASVALIASLDPPLATATGPSITPWYSAETVGITVAHVGDTRMLLCRASDGKAISLTHHHHADEPGEAHRLRRLGANLVSDSFGEQRWMGALANTRAFGDTKFKRLGVTPEPEINRFSPSARHLRPEPSDSGEPPAGVHPSGMKVYWGADLSFLIGFSDGVSDVLSDQEVVDICRGYKTPAGAAKAVLDFALELGTQDNCTVVVVPFLSWGKTGGTDETKERRDYRRSQIDVFRSSRT